MCTETAALRVKLSRVRSTGRVNTDAAPLTVQNSSSAM